MYFHLSAALLFWSIGLLIPAPNDHASLTFVLMGFITFLLFLNECLETTKQKLLKDALNAEKKNIRELSSFTGRLVGIQNNKSPFSDCFTYIIFFNGEYEVPLFCKREEVIKKIQQLDEGTCLTVYYSNYILIEVESVHRMDLESVAQDEQLSV
ncbi:hypothetical protein A8F94_21950 [Bacillus sp. FJAT-27225]|uniref:hypothetical protein n=1 Tax=Bacillus sp. FJAT-27225 TaxID=1743144 RepID=UPI00080C2664|nr:hypothetical protein [Bacillus sp. FJAT-27225]OCA81540.1 hypothetical protein A8F94_21950 [Bacillus sp. FJAT-27225]